MKFLIIKFFDQLHSWVENLNLFNQNFNQFFKKLNLKKNCVRN